MAEGLREGDRGGEPEAIGTRACGEIEVERPDRIPEPVGLGVRQGVQELVGDYEELRPPAGEVRAPKRRAARRARGRDEDLGEAVANSSESVNPVSLIRSGAIVELLPVTEAAGELPIRGPAESLAAAEASVARRLEPELREHGQLTLDVFNAISTIVEAGMTVPFEQLPAAKKVGVCLLTRISNDVRCASLLALRGYPLQALSLVPSTWEAAYTVAAIGSDDALAGEWISHEDPLRPFKPPRKLLLMGLRAIGHPEPERQAAVEYRVYSQLCMPKHSNPIVQKEFGFIEEDDAVLVSNGPDASEGSVRASWFALEHGSACAFIALAAFVKDHASDEVRAEFEPVVLDLGRRRKDLEDRAKKRWGTDDPFPGLWKKFTTKAP